MTRSNRTHVSGADRFGFLVESILGKIEPGVCVHSERQTGKTTALMRCVHDRHRGGACIVAMNPAMAEMIKNEYRIAYPNDLMPDVVPPSRVMNIIEGRNDPIYIDEWWNLGLRTQWNLKNTGRVHGAVGTLNPVTAIPL